jgi:hypothetical protein
VRQDGRKPKPKVWFKGFDGLKKRLVGGVALNFDASFELIKTNVGRGTNFWEEETVVSSPIWPNANGTTDKLT